MASSAAVQLQLGLNIMPRTSRMLYEEAWKRIRRHDGLEQFELMERLPLEVQLKIWNHVGARVVTLLHRRLSEWFSFDIDALRYKFPTLGAAISRDYRLQWKLFGVQPRNYLIAHHETDIFSLGEFELPSVVHTDVWPLPGMHPQALPVERVLCPFHVLRAPSDAAAAMSAFQTTSHWVAQGIVEQATALGRTEALPFGRLPKLREMFLTFESISEDWWMDGYQVHYPEIINRPDNSTHWSRCEGVDYMAQSAHFSERGMTAGTGIPWPRDLDHVAALYEPVRDRAWRHYALHDQRGHCICDCGGVRGDMYDYSDLANYIPNIGLRGYSQDSTSLGGQWAGFRVHMDRPDLVEFTPLSWEEVREIFEARLGAWYMNEVPAMVIKITIVPAGEVAAPDEPHHGWEDITGAPVNDVRNKPWVLWQTILAMMHQSEANIAYLDAWGPRKSFMRLLP